MAYRDLRTFLDDLREAGELAHVEVEVDPNQEIGAICRKVCREGGPALLFERVKGTDISFAANVFGSRGRIARAFGCDGYETLGDKWSDLTGRGGIPPTLVADAPCQEVSTDGDGPLLDLIPWPVWNENDAGPYITLGVCIGRDRESGHHNAAPYRMLRLDGRRATMNFAPGRDLGILRSKYIEAGEPMPAAVAIGVDPMTAFAAACPFNPEVDELDMAGALLGESLEMVKCRTIDLEVPATAEIVLEGRIVPEITAPDGPFGEYHGYYGPPHRVPVFEVSAVTHRKDPIYQGLYIGMPPTENAYFETASIELEIHRGLRSVPGYLRFNMVIAGARRNGVLQIRKHFEGHGKMAGLALLGLHAASDIKTAIIVDDDIDPFDWDAVNWALSTRFNPAVDVEIMTGLPGNPLDLAMPKEEAYKANRISKIILDATKPLIEPLPDTCLPHPDVMEAVRKNWARYGIGRAVGATRGSGDTPDVSAEP